MSTTEPAVLVTDESRDGECPACGDDLNAHRVKATIVGTVWHCETCGEGWVEQ